MDRKYKNKLRTELCILTEDDNWDMTPAVVDRVTVIKRLLGIDEGLTGRPRVVSDEEYNNRKDYTISELGKNTIDFSKFTYEHYVLLQNYGYSRTHITTALGVSGTTVSKLLNSAPKKINKLHHTTKKKAMESLPFKDPSTELVYNPLKVKKDNKVVTGSTGYLAHGKCYWISDKMITDYLVSKNITKETVINYSEYRRALNKLAKYINHYGLHKMNPATTVNYMIVDTSDTRIAVNSSRNHIVRYMEYMGLDTTNVHSKAVLRELMESRIARLESGDGRPSISLLLSSDHGY